MPLIDGSEIRLTIARYFTPTGRFIQKPYDDPEKYKKDLTQRFLNGEFVHADSIKMPDSLKFKTLKTKRLVYGGGGIMPDFFVSLDTSETSNYFSDLVQGGHLNTYPFQYVNENRANLKKQYPSFDDFNKNFKMDDAFMNQFFEYVRKEDSKLEFNEKEYQTSKNLIKLRLKANIAQDLWGTKELFQVYNDSNEILLRAIQILKGKEYESVKLDR
jgi:carboxyl-terminal processing protease